MSKTFRLAVAVAMLGLSGSAFAYLDPGTGSLIIQGLIAAVGAVLVALKLYWHRVKKLFSLGRTQPEAVEKEGAAEPASGSARESERK